MVDHGVVFFSMASLMRAVRFHKIGDININNLTVDLIPLPIRQPNELLIKINASAVNPVTKIDIVATSV